MLVYIITCLNLVLFETTTHEIGAPITLLDKGIYPVEQGAVGIQFFIDLQNIHNSMNCIVESRPKECCLADRTQLDCITDAVYGDNYELVMPKHRETLFYVYPTLYPYDQIGICKFLIKTRCGQQELVKELDVDIPFNTEFDSKMAPGALEPYSNAQRSDCDSLDQDTLNNCAPVDCDLKYSGLRPFFDDNNSSCVSVPECNTNVKKELPDIVYVPYSNVCRNLDVPVTFGDIYGITTGLAVITEPKISKPRSKNSTVHIVSNCSTISQNLMLLKNLVTGRLCPLFSNNPAEYERLCKNAVLSICACVAAGTAAMLSIICFLHTMVWMYNRWSDGDINNFCARLRTKCKKREKKSEDSPLRRDVTNNLLKEVIVRDVPIELRDGVVDICDRIGKEVRKKRRYRLVDLGSQVNLLETSSDSSESSNR